VNYGTTTTPAAKARAIADRAKRLYFAYHTTDPTQRSEDGQIHWSASSVWYFLHIPGTDAGDVK